MLLLLFPLISPAFFLSPLCSCALCRQLLLLEQLWLLLFDVWEKHREWLCSRISSLGFFFFPSHALAFIVFNSMQQEDEGRSPLSIETRFDGRNWSISRQCNEVSPKWVPDFLVWIFIAYLSPPLMNSPTFRSCNLLGRSSRSKCSIRSGSSWPRFPTEPLSCLVRRLEILVKLKRKKKIFHSDDQHAQSSPSTHRWISARFWRGALFMSSRQRETKSRIIKIEKNNLRWWKKSTICL